jgi:ATP phosphoribosyltransferase
MITLAVAKGRILKEALAVLKKQDIVPEVNPDDSRKLVIGTNDESLRLLIVRASDVPTYVHHGVADLGIVGKDTLLEYSDHQLYELADLGIAKCRMIVAGLESNPEAMPRVSSIKPYRVASKYVSLTERYFAEAGIQVEVIKLYGSMELAPVLDLADCIVDIVDTGNTLKANGLVELEHIVNISTRLIANKASAKVKRSAVKKIQQAFSGKLAH